MAIIDLLVKLQLIDDRQHDAVMSRSHSNSGGVIVQQVAELGYATEGAVARAISVELGLPRIDLSMTPPEPSALALLDARTCATHYVLPVALRENGELLWLAMADPTDQEAVGLVRRKTQKRVRPAVAGPTEILRAARTLYTEKPAAAPGLSPIEIRSADESEAFEVVNVSEEIDKASPLSRIAEQLGVPMPSHLVRSKAQAKAPADEYEISLDDALPLMDSGRPNTPLAIPPKTDPRLRRAQPAAGFDELFAPPPALADGHLELSAEDLTLVEALRSSMEKGALILRALAELCVEKGVFTREEMRKRNQRP